MDWGEFQLHRVSDGNIWLDGGAMFGVVPKSLWAQKTQPDELNRICLGLNCLLVRSQFHNLLIDTGCGHKYSEKELSIYGITHPPDVISELHRIGVTAADIDYVINTHLHFDHCGGNTHLENGSPVPTFPNAVYVVRRQELEAATHLNARTRGSYFVHNWEVLRQLGQLRVISEDEEIVPGVTCVLTPGHTLGHQSVRIESNGRVLFYIADLCPTQAHVPLAWIMGYDLFPLTTLETRVRIYRQAIEEKWVIFFEHDPLHPAGRLTETDGRIGVLPVAWGPDSSG